MGHKQYELNPEWAFLTNSNHSTQSTDVRVNLALCLWSIASVHQSSSEPQGFKGDANKTHTCWFVSCWLETVKFTQYRFKCWFVG